MKRLLCVIIILTLAILSGISAGAEVIRPGKTVYTIVTVDDTEEIIHDAPDAEQMEDYDSYELIISGETALTVEQREVPSLTKGVPQVYYSASFELPGTTGLAHLYGLSADNIEEIQHKLINSYVSGANFDIEDMSFIDTEKTRDEDMDDLMCWAATSSNMLTYTGWAAVAGFDSTDDVFEAYIDSFENKGGHILFGIYWFFNGSDPYKAFLASGIEEGAAAATPGTGKYLPDYASDMLANIVELDGAGAAGMTSLGEHLEQGCGIGVSLALYHNGGSAGGHAVTCWGFIEDTSVNSDDPARYTHIFLTDSDSDEQRDTDRRDAPNILNVYSLTADDSGNYWFSIGEDSTFRYDAMIADYTWLLPYSADLPKETDAGATRDKTTTADLCVSDCYIGTDFESDLVKLGKMESGTKFYHTPVLDNNSDVSYSGNTRIAATIKRADGTQVYTRNLNTNLNMGSNGSVTYGKGIKVDDGLTEGDYTLTYVVNGNHSVTEAYYYNNTYSYSFKVRDSYLLGDLDKSGDIEITDATYVQRILAGYKTNLDGRAGERGMVTSSDDLSIVDATVIQRYLAGYKTKYPIKTKKLYN